MTAVTRIDAGPLVALVEKSQPQSVRCRSTLLTLSLPLLTAWPAFTEAMDLVCQIGGWPLQRNLWRYVEEAILRVYWGLRPKEPAGSSRVQSPL